MNSMTSYPNTLKHLVFKEFDMGRHPSELAVVKRFKRLKYNTLMTYYTEWKVLAREKNKIIEKFEKEARCHLREDKDGMKRRGTYEPFIREFYPSAHAYLENKPYKWFANKTFMEIVDILAESPWELKN